MHLLSYVAATLATRPGCVLEFVSAQAATGFRIEYEDVIERGVEPNAGFGLQRQAAVHDHTALLPCDGAEQFGRGARRFDYIHIERDEARLRHLQVFRPHAYRHLLLVTGL